VGKISAAQAAHYAYQAGFRGNALVTAVAVAMGESSLNTSAMGDVGLQTSKWGPSIGLWQIRSLNAEHHTGGSRDRARLIDPVFNAQSAFSISSGGSNFSPWTVYKTGAYKQYLGQAQAAAAALPQSGQSFAAGIQGGDAMVAAGMQSGAFGSSTMGDLGFAGFDAGSASDHAKSLYGYLGWFVDHPEVGPIILQAAEQGWDQARLQGALVNTNWWKRTSESARQWDALVTMDRATANRRIQETMTSIGLQAGKLGIGLSRNGNYAIATQALRNGWNPEEISLALAAQMRWNPLSWATGGGVGQIMSEVRKLGADYMIPVTARQSWDWARRIAGGASTIEAVQQQMQLLAALKYPHLGTEISRGVTPAQYFAPHRSVIAETLEMSPESVDFMGNTRWRNVTTFHDPVSKKNRPMTLTETARYARMDAGWAKTDNAWDSVTEAGDAILQIFGEVAR